MQGMLGRLTSYLDTIRAVLGNEPRTESFATYCAGLLSCQPRKTAESIAASASTTVKESTNLHQRLLYVIGQAVWDDKEVRVVAERYVLDAMTEREAIAQWIIDDTGFIKQGKHSVGVKHQYTGTAGKVTNCQVATTLVASTPTTQAPLDVRIYLPKEWTDNPVVRKLVKIPDAVTFKTKPELALELITAALERKVPIGRISADCAYGDSSAFRASLRARKLDICVGVKPATSAWSVDASDKRRGPKTSVQAISNRLACEKITWRHGTKGPMSSFFGARRIVTFRELADHGIAEPLWLLAERLEDEHEPTKFAVITAARDARIKDLVSMWKERYRTERAYQDTKQNLGFADYQGRLYPGWQHHATAVFVCAAFLVAEQSRRFAPRTTGEREAIRTSLRLQRHYPDSFATIQIRASRIVNDWLANSFPASITGNDFRPDLNRAA